MDQRFAPALSEFHRLLAHCATQLQLDLRFALLGGLAVSIWGVIRATQDIDFIADCDPSPIGNIPLRAKIQSFLKAQDCSAEWRVGATDDPIPLLLHVELAANFHDMSADILWAHRNWQREALQRVVVVDFDGESIPVLHPEDLILMKIDAGGPQDLFDVEQLLAAGQSQIDIDRLKSSAARLRLSAILARCIRNSNRK
jgi:predicted nucleotidyltransferase